MKQPNENKIYTAALYLRLSKDDEFLDPLTKNPNLTTVGSHDIIQLRHIIPFASLDFKFFMLSSLITN